MADKLISFGIPCYNSSAYMDKCIESLLKGTGYADDVQVIIVDDGSTKDDTPAKADAWAERYPDLVKAVHQENGGHGIAVMKAVANADGIYFKNFDSDDWADEEAIGQLVAKLRELVADGNPPDLMITNYIYDHFDEGITHSVSYRDKLPVDRMFTWDEMGHFSMQQNLLIHTLCYRTEVLRQADLKMPMHTFYVDNIYAYVPFPLCKKLYYLDLDVYHYYIGRDDQSVNETVLTSRIDHYWRVARVMRDAYHVYDEVESKKLQGYMMQYFTIIMAICSVFSKLSDRADAMDELDKLWAELKAYDSKMYATARNGIVSLATNLPGTLGRSITIGFYKLAQKIVKFN